MFTARSLEKVLEVLELRQRLNVGGVFLVIVISTYTFLFVAAVLQREVTLGDLKSGFMQSGEDVSDRPRGKLYASLPPGGIPLPDGTWVEEGSLIQLNAAVYGLVNAPSAWKNNCARH